MNWLELREIWRRFKKLRRSKVFETGVEKGFITVLEREEMIDTLFKIIEEMSETKCEG